MESRDIGLGKKTLVSFDLDGTLTDISFVDSVWLDAIPREYAAKNGLAFEEARNIVTKEYGEIGRERLEWYDLGYWIQKFKLDICPRDVLISLQHKIRVFPEVPEVLDGLKRANLRLVIVTNARREFADLELERTRISPYFDGVFSSTSDFRLIKKTPKLFRKICDLCNVDPEEVVHVGDEELFDYKVPSKIGITAFFLDRTRKHSGTFVIHSLKELNRKLQDESDASMSDG